MWFIYKIAVAFIFFLSAILSAIIMYVRFSQNRYVTGKEIPAEKKAQAKQRYILTPLFLLGFGVYFGFFWNAPVLREDPNAWKTKDNKTMAYVMMQDFVKDRLRSPGSAKFEWITEPACTIEKDGFEYRISSWVDSQNDFGALLRTRFSGVVRQVDKENWELVSLNFSENTQESTSQIRMTIQEFVDAYNYNAPEFRARQNSKWDIKEMEKVNSIDLTINEAAKAVITFEKVPPYYLNGFMFYIGDANNVEIRVESIGALFSMIGAFEPGSTYNEMERFINSIFAQEHGKEIELPHGAKCTVLDVGNIAVFSVGYE
jgi:hypothetical protein